MALGIEKEEIPKIFWEGFIGVCQWQTRQGVGIGLFLAREIIQAQKGYIKSDIKGEERVLHFSVFFR